MRKRKKTSAMYFIQYLKNALEIVYPDFKLNVGSFMVDGALSIREAVKEKFDKK